MIPNTAIIVKPDIDFNTFLVVCLKVLEFSPAAEADASRIDHPDPQKFWMCLEKIKNGGNPWNFLHYAVMVVADEVDLVNIIETTGLPVIATETVARNVMLAVIAGSVRDWRDAVIAGTNHEEHNVRACFCQLKSHFELAGVDAWNECRLKPLNDSTFKLEDKRK